MTNDLLTFSIHHSPSSSLYDRIAQNAYLFNFDLHDVARLQEDGWLACHADAGRRAREDQVAYLKRKDLR